MSISSQISRISGNVSAALTAIANKGVTVPSGSDSDDLATLIAQISGGGSGTITITDVANTTGTTAQIENVIATHHVIHLEFSDSTDTDIDVYYDDSLIGTMITSYEPVTYSSKTVSLAQLDGVTWYQPSVIPIGVQLIDYAECEYNKALNANGAEITQEWYYLSDFTPVETTMNFSYRAGYWTYIGFYNESKTALATMAVYNYATQDPNDSNTGYGNIIGTNLPAGTKFIRISGTSDDSNHMSLIRTA